MSRHPRLGAKMSRPDPSTRPGRLTPIPSQTMRGCAARTAAIDLRQLADEQFRIAWRRPHRLRHEARIQACEADRRRLRPQIDADDPGALGVEVQESWAPSARHAADRAFGDPAFFDQLIDDGGHRAALQARSTSQIGARHRLQPAEKIEGDLPVDLASRFAGGNFEIGEVDLAHRGLLAGPRQRDGRPTRIIPRNDRVPIQNTTRTANPGVAPTR